MGISKVIAHAESMVIAADPSNVGQVIDFIARFLTEAGCPEGTKNFVSICVDEVFANISQYAYRNCDGLVHIDVATFSEPDRAQIVFKDEGVAFNPLDREDPDTTLPVEERHVGGLGIFIVKEITDEVSYVRDGDYNVLTIVKRF